MKEFIAVMVTLLSVAAASKFAFEAPQDVRVDCDTLKDEYVAIVTWSESQDAVSKAGIMTYKILYESSVQPGVWRDQKVDSIGRAFIKLAPGAHYKFKVMGLSRKGASEPSEIAAERCSF